MPLIQGKENNQTYLSSPKVHCFTGIDVPVDVSPLTIRNVLFILYKKPKNYLNYLKSISMIFKVLNLEIE